METLVCFDFVESYLLRFEQYVFYKIAFTHYSVMCYANGEGNNLGN